tara:strand:- start:95 stop:370 length:276 start_codon:yes stop_codon:yes gene_type:complete
MNISKQRLLEIIDQEVKRVQREGTDHLDHEGSMARSQLLRSAEYSTKLMQMIGDDTMLDAWVQSKLTKASDYLGAVYHHLHKQDVLGEEEE